MLSEQCGPQAVIGTITKNPLDAPASAILKPLFPQARASADCGKLGDWEIPHYCDTP